MTNSQKITNALRVFQRETASIPLLVYEGLRKYVRVENDSFDTQYYFADFYLSFTYYRKEFSSMSLYTSRFSSECPMICFERTGDIIIGKALDRINIYNGCSPTAQDMKNIDLELEAFEYLEDILRNIEPMLADIARKFL